MKKYLREKKKWVTEEEYDQYHISKEKKKCRGGKPHDYVLMLPSYAKWDGKSPYNAELYYETMKERRIFIENQKKMLEEKGIIIKEWNGYISRLYICSVCQKQKHEWTGS